MDTSTSSAVVPTSDARNHPVGCVDRRCITTHTTQNISRAAPVAGDGPVSTAVAHVESTVAPASCPYGIRSVKRAAPTCTAKLVAT